MDFGKGLRKYQLAPQAALRGRPEESGPLPGGPRYDRSERMESSQVVARESGQPRRGEGRELFDNVISVRCKGESQREEVVKYLRFSSFARPDKAGGGVSINLTEESNPLFLYLFHLREADFPAFKQEQKLRVDFASFMDMVAELLSYSMREEDPDTRGRYLIELEVQRSGEAVLSVVEINRFKETYHLCLRFKCSSDQQLKEYLADKINRQAEENEGLRIQNVKLQKSCSNYSHEVELLRAKMGALAEESDRAQQNLRAQCDRKLQQLKEQGLSRELAGAKERDDIRKILEQQYSNQANDLNAAMMQLTRKNQELTEKLFYFQSQQRQLKTKNHFLESEVKGTTGLLEEVKAQLKESQGARFALEQSLGELSARNKSLQDKLADKEQTIDVLKGSSQTHVSSLESKYSELKDSNERLKEKLDKAAVQLSKAVNGLQDMKAKYTKKKDKMLLRDEVIKKQQLRVQELEALLAEASRERSELAYKLQLQEKASSELAQRVDQREKELEKVRQSAVENSELIQYLSKENNELKGGGRLPRYPKFDEYSKTSFVGDSQRVTAASLADKYPATSKSPFRSSERFNLTAGMQSNSSVGQPTPEKVSPTPMPINEPKGGQTRAVRYKAPSSGLQ